MVHAVLLHPCFVYGGDQNNHVIAAVYERLLDSAVTPHRFDFSSADRAVAQAEAVAQVRACDGPVIVIGYSFGGEIAAALTDPAVLGWVLIAPALFTPQFVSPAAPLRAPALPPAATDPRPKLVVLAERDAWFGGEVLDPLLDQWTACQRQIVPTADHFFSATTDQVTDHVVNWTLTQAVAGLDRTMQA